MKNGKNWKNGQNLKNLIFALVFALSACGVSMASNLTELSTWTDPILGPDPGDALQAVPVRTMTEEVMGRVNVLRETGPYHTSDKNYWSSLIPLEKQATSIVSGGTSGLKIFIPNSAAHIFYLPLNNSAELSANGNRKVKSVVLFPGNTGGIAGSFTLRWDDGGSVIQTVNKLAGDATVTFTGSFPSPLAAHGGFEVNVTATTAGDMHLRSLVVFEGAAVP